MHAKECHLLAGAMSSNRPSRMQRKHKVAFVTIVPSPYQRDLFGALAAREEIDLNVLYLESAAPDSPWPDKELRAVRKDPAWLLVSTGQRARTRELAYSRPFGL